MTPPSRAEPGNRLLPGAALARGPAPVLPLRAVRRRGRLRGPHGLRALHAAGQGGGDPRRCSRRASASSTRRSTTTAGGLAGGHEAPERVHRARRRSTRRGRCCSTSSASRRACRAPRSRRRRRRVQRHDDDQDRPDHVPLQGHGQDRGGRRERAPGGACGRRPGTPRAGHRGGDDHDRDARRSRAARACAVETDLRVTGPAAQFGRGVMQDVRRKLMGQFADCLAEEMQRRRRRRRGAAGPAGRRRADRGRAAAGSAAAAVAASAARSSYEETRRRPAARRAGRRRRARRRRSRRPPRRGRRASADRPRCSTSGAASRGAVLKRRRARRRRGARRGRRHRRLEETRAHEHRPGRQAAATATDGAPADGGSSTSRCRSTPDMLTFPRVPPPALCVYESHERVRRADRRRRVRRRLAHRAATSSCQDDHVGTHCDARKHIVPDAGGPETIPLEYCISRRRAARLHRRRERATSSAPPRSRPSSTGSATRSRSATSSSSTPAPAPTTPRSATAPTTRA